jgi:hypothetical protein
LGWRDVDWQGGPRSLFHRRRRDFVSRFTGGVPRNGFHG